MTDQDVGRLPRLRRYFYYAYTAALLGVNAVVLIPNVGQVVTPDNTLFSVSWLALHGASVLVLLTSERMTRAAIGSCLILSAPVMASAAWSVSPLDSLIYGAMLTGNIFVAHMMVLELGFDETLRIISRIILGLATAGLVAYAVEYQQVFYVDVHERLNIVGSRPLRGFFPHKVMASLYAVVGCVLAAGTFRGRIRGFAIVLLVLFVLLTGSSTGIILLVVAAASFGVVVVATRNRLNVYSLITIAAAALAPVVVVVSMASQWILDVLGRDGTLTGRTILWQWGLGVWMERPLLGWGLTAYFNSAEGSLISDVVGSFRDYEVPHFHQSFIQTAVDNGIVGLAILLFIVATTAIRSYRACLTNLFAGGLTTIVLLSVLLAASTSMFIFLNYNHFATFLLIVLYAGWSFQRSNTTATPRRDARQTTRTG